MKCSICDYSIAGPSVLIHGRGVCNSCAEEIRNENGDGQHCVVNEILAYMHRSAVTGEHGEIGGTGKHEEIVSECAEKYKPKDILGAKQYLLNEYGDKIKEYDEKIHGELGRNRIDSQGRKAIIANLHDIMTAFDILKEMQCDISALSDVRGPIEEYCKTTLESRVAQLEMKFSLIDSLNEENAKLR